MAVDTEALFAEAMKLTESPAPAAAAPPAAEPADDPADGKLEPVDPPAAAAAPAKPVEPAKTRLERSFEDLAREKVKLRTEAKAVAAERARAERGAALLEAAEKGDAMSLLTAAKIPWNAAAKQVLEGKVDAPAPKAEPDDRDRRLAALEAEIQQTKVQAQRTALVGQVKTAAKSDPKFHYVAGRQAEELAVQFLERYWNETGELPAENIEASITVALEAVENKLAREAEAWRPLLQGSAGNPATPAVPPKAVSQSATKTITNDLGSGPKPAPGSTRPAPKTPEDYFAEALKALESQPAE